LTEAWVISATRRAFSVGLTMAVSSGLSLARISRRLVVICENIVFSGLSMTHLSEAGVYGTGNFIVE
jgi:hypothetical protein